MGCLNKLQSGKQKQMPLPFEKKKSVLQNNLKNVIQKNVLERAKCAF